MKSSDSVSVEVVDRALRELLVGAGAHNVVTDDVVGALIATSLRGIDSHGIGLLPRILKRDEAGRCQLSAPASPAEDTEDRAVAVLDAGQAPGQHACMAAARIAVERAQRFGIGMTTVRESTHFGACAPYLLEVLQHGFTAMVGSNSTPSMVAFGANFASLGNNPFGFAAPVLDGPDLVFDFSCGVMSFGRLARLRQAGNPVPDDAFVKPEKAPQNNPVYEISGKLEYAALPFGGHKGASVAMMIEVMAGLLSGGNFGMACETMDEERFRGPSHFVLAFDASAFGVRDLAADMATYIAGIRQDQGDIRLPGENSQATEAARRTNGIPITRDFRQEIKLWASRLGVVTEAVGELS